MKYRVGIDVGSTHTDAVIIDENANIVSATKNPDNS
jgi:N-methylhydantoinase A/oxoprolinase/acetone carboxylase beta subunit